MDKQQWYVTGSILGAPVFGGLAYLLGANRSDVFISALFGFFAGKFIGWYIGSSKEKKQQTHESNQNQD